MKTIIRSLTSTALLLSLPLCAACAPDMDAPGAELAGSVARLDAHDAEDALEAEISSNVVQNGIDWNGIKINGTQLNGIKINGIKINGIKINGTQLNGVTLDTFQIVNGTQLSGTIQGGTPLELYDFIGSTMVAEDEKGNDVALRIDAIEEADDPEIIWYTIALAKGGVWTHACGTDAATGEPIRAIPLPGRWDLREGAPGGGSYIDDDGMFTFACEGSVVQKCVDAGYKPWGTATECDGDTCAERPLKEAHQACTRMMRADYCGDGAPHTIEHTLINLWDAFSIQEEADSSFSFEAEWASGGASCINHPRWTAKGAQLVKKTTKYIEDHCPALLIEPCDLANSTFNTGVGFDTPLEVRALLRSSSCAPPEWPGGCEPSSP
jgi:hypothetical protein